MGDQKRCNAQVMSLPRADNQWFAVLASDNFGNLWRDPEVLQL